MTNLKQRGYETASTHTYSRGKVQTSKLAQKTTSSYTKEAGSSKKSKGTSKTRAVKTSMKEIDSDDGDMSPINSDQEFNPQNLPAEENTPQHVNGKHPSLPGGELGYSGGSQAHNALFGEMVRRNLQTPQMKTLSIHTINTSIKKNQLLQPVSYATSQTTRNADSGAVLVAGGGRSQKHADSNQKVVNRSKNQVFK